MTPFTAEDEYLVEKFIADFEDAACVFGWNEIQKIVYGKRLCQGVAREAIKTTAVNSWGELKKFLTNEFQKKVNSARIHFLLVNRRKSHDKSYHAYLIAMRKIGYLGMLEDEAVIEHTINGILDSEFNKSILYGAATMDEFRRKLELYEKMKGRDEPKQKERFPIDGQKTKPQSAKTETMQKMEKQSDKCFNCGLKGHLSKNCEKKKDGPRCFKCDLIGHISKDCPTTKMRPAETYVVESSSGVADKTMKDVIIGGQQVSGFVDTGSSSTLISDKLYFRIGCPELLDGEKVDITGMGKAKMKSLGSFSTVLTIDGGDYHVTVNILPACEVPSDLLLGRDVLNQAELRIKLGEVLMIKIDLNEAEDCKSDGKSIEACNPIKRVRSHEKIKFVRDVKSDHQNLRQRPAAENNLVYCPVEKRLDDKKLDCNKPIPVYDYDVGDFVALNSRKFVFDRQIVKKFLGPYKIINIHFPDRYDVVKVGSQEGPSEISTSAKYMKPFAIDDDETDMFSDEDLSKESFEANVQQRGRICGISK